MQRSGVSILEIMIGTVVALLITIPAFRFAINLTKDWQNMSADLTELQTWDIALSQIKCDLTEDSPCTAAFSLMNEGGNVIIDETAPVGPAGWILRASCENNLIYLSIERTIPTPSNKRLSSIPVCSVIP